MLINANTIVYGKRILLVPYGKHHVKKYHTWMENEEIQQLTASLPLSLDEEYQMQQTWLNDQDKCTFIILSKDIFERTSDEIEAMIGDVNLFLNNADDSHCGEIEIMIAEETARKKGCGLETLCTFMRYVIETLKMTRFIAKIGLQNQASISLFTNKLHFHTIETCAVFQEVTLERLVDEQFLDFLQNQTPDYRIGSYDNKL